MLHTYLAKMGTGASGTPAWFHPAGRAPPRCSQTGGSCAPTTLPWAPCHMSVAWCCELAHAFYNSVLVRA